MRRLLVLVCLYALEPFEAIADDVFTCGGAEVRFSYEKRKRMKSM